MNTQENTTENKNRQPQTLILTYDYLQEVDNELQNQLWNNKSLTDEQTKILKYRSIKISEIMKEVVNLYDSYKEHDSNGNKRKY